MVLHQLKNPIDLGIRGCMVGTRYIEQMGTGTGDMIRRCRETGLPEPEFSVRDGFVATIRRQAVPVKKSRPEPVALAPPVTPPVTPPVAPLVMVLVRLLGELRELGNAEIRQHLGLRDRTHLRERYLDPSLQGGWIEMTIPDKPNSRLQKYRLTPQGVALLSTVAPDKTMP